MTRTTDEPTAEGLRRYPASAGYNIELADPIPCVCHEGCQSRCAGECGCEACSVQFSVFCDMSGRYGDEVLTPEAEGEALVAYRSIS